MVEGGKNMKFFHGMASSRRTNQIYCILDGQKRMEKKEETVAHIEDYFSSLYVDEGWERRSLDKLVFDATGEQKAQWLERKFEEDEVCQAVDLAGVEVR